jgi:UDP-N-acetylglucosamine--N-acetylmuramyl-(pentapeptide) pyrophosphoryl-undecaprenol N-acetylglucosamine transferase
MTTDILLVGGGTAGHVLPAVATAQALARMRPDLTLGFAGLDGSLEERLVAVSGHDFHAIRAVPLPRRPSIALLLVVPRLLRAVRSARRLIDDESVRAVVSFGGYVALPVSLAARRRVPLVLHEQNSRPGLANRIAGRFADRVAVTYPSSLDLIRSTGRVHVTGNPVQERLRELDVVARRGPGRERLGLEPRRPTLLAFGGSQGARSINQCMTDAAAAWQSLGVQVLHVTGHRDHADALDRWRDAGVDPERADAGVKVLPFLDDMADAYAAADVVVARAGATTIAELTVLGIPSILIPYPHATADHQRGNADAVVGAGAAMLIEDAALSPDALATAVASIVTDSARAGAMSLAARAWARPEAAEGLARLVLGVLGEGGTDA